MSGTASPRARLLRRISSLIVASVVVAAALPALVPATAAVAAQSGTVTGWGVDWFGQATPPAGLTGVTHIAAGGYHSLALKSDGTVVSWGDNDSGESQVPSGLASVTAIAAGSFHSLALNSDGSVKAWGDNDFGQATVPSGLSGVTAIAAGAFFSLAVTSGGTVVGWGSNDTGQTRPPAGLDHVRTVAAGTGHGLALRDDGTVAGWGDNSFGEASPPAGLSGVTAIAAGAYSSLALKSDGTVVAWGSNEFGERNVPAGLSGVVAIAAGAYHDLALKADGSIVAWGLNSDGQVSVPANLGHAFAIAAGETHSLAVIGTAQPVTTTVQDNATGVRYVRYGEWYGVVDPAASGGSYRHSSAAGTSAGLTFTGTTVTWVTRKGPDQGIATLSIGGQVRGTYDLYASAASGQVPIKLSGLGTGSHALQVTVTGRRNAVSTGTDVAVDAFIAGSTTCQDTANAVRWGTWTGSASANASGGTYRASSTSGATATLVFTGTGVDLVTAKGPAYGQARVVIDNTVRATLDLYRASSVQWKVTFAYPGLSAGTHTVKVVVLGTKNVASTGKAVVVDAFVVHS